MASGRDLLRLADHFQSRQGPVVIAAPDYEHITPIAPDAQESVARDPTRDALRGLSFRPLRFAAQEGRAIARKIDGSTLLMGEAATKGALMKVAGPKLLHIATHGFFLQGPSTQEAPSPFDEGLFGFDRPTHFKSNVDNPLLRSGIALAGANRGHENQALGILTAFEVSQLDLLGTKLVILSACKTGLGEIASGEGVYGLRRALSIAGAETQVMSLWSVDDAATCELMEAYYDKLLAGEGRVEALRRAQLEMLGHPDLAHPYYWACFIASGNDAPLRSSAETVDEGGRPDSASSERR
ncbi:CHAT domain-containing protein [Polyangium jinanense]|nr:CHAT domain-containing protein [Polyangium jinanense]